MNPFIKNLIQLGHHPNDSKEERLKKSSLLVVSGPFAIAGLVWGILYFSNGLLVPGAIPFSYGVLSIINIISFGFSKQYIFFRNSQLVLILILPFALQISLGGFVPSSAVMYWAIIAPAGAMFFDSIKRSVYWFGAYIIMVIIAYFINDYIPNYVNWDLSDSFINVLFLMNIVGVSSIVFGILYYFVSTITNLNKDIEKKSEALREQSEKLKEMDGIKSRFFANISHEFRTPLTLILGLVKKQINNPSTPPNLSESKVMERNAHRLLQLINQLLDLSKLESGELKLNASKNDFILFAKNTTAQFESMASDKSIKLTFNGYPIQESNQSEAFSFYFDQEKMQKVLANLLSNAIKFTPTEENISVEVEPLKDAQGGYNKISIKVINTGTEIPEDKLPHVFDRFFQVDGASNRQFEGTGIGLALVKELVELHHGQVSVESKMRKTCFSIELPTDKELLQDDEIEGSVVSESMAIYADAEQALETSLQEIQGEYTLIHTSKDNLLQILVVEDNTDLRSFIKGILEKDYQILEAGDGVEGFELAQAAIPDLIVSDVMMPRMDGYDLCKHLKTEEKTNHIPVILLTAKAAKENKLEGLEIGADDYLIKPFDEKELKIRIKNLISIREKLQQKFSGEIKYKPKEIKVSSAHQKFLETVKEVVEKNIDNEAFGVDDLGKAIGMSRSQLHRKLKALTNQSATTFIRNYRLYRAADLLKQDSGNITEIAFDVGFNSQTYFSSSFQELFGCSPSEYRMKE